MCYILKDIDNLFVERSQNNNNEYEAYRKHGWHSKTSIKRCLEAILLLPSVDSLHRLSTV